MGGARFNPLEKPRNVLILCQIIDLSFEHLLFLKSNCQWLNVDQLKKSRIIHMTCVLKYQADQLFFPPFTICLTNSDSLLSKTDSETRETMR